MNIIKDYIKGFASRFTQGVVYRWERVFLVAGVSLGLTSILCNLNFNFLEANLYDLRVAHGFQKEPSSEIVLITVDDPTVQGLDQFAPLNLDFHSRLVEKIAAHRPKGIGYLIDLNDIKQSDPDSFNSKTNQERLLNTIRSLEDHAIPFRLGTPFDVTGEVHPPAPFNQIQHSVAFIHRDTNVFGEDKVTRRALTYLGTRPAFQTALALDMRLIPEGFRPRGNFSVPEINTEYFLFQYHRNTVLHPETPRNLPYRRISAGDLLAGSVDPNHLTGKIILVGTLLREDSNDYVFTPYSRASFSNPRIVVHANVLDAVINNHGIEQAPSWVYWVQTFITSSTVMIAVLGLNPILGVFVTLGVASILLIIGHLAFHFRGLWILESAPLIGTFVSYYLGVPYRLIREYKRRWDYQRKNEILTQVESLKTNFLSLVTHDLKTPVARIQGLAEVLLRQPQSGLDPNSKLNLANIIDATEELNRFISSILELSKIESNKLKLQIDFKDVNQLIEKLVENFNPQARSKKVLIRTQLEPLFPIKIDSNLISKVLSNLIDNAIRYSPEMSEVTIQSREVDQKWVEITIIDGGIGMSSEEVARLFSRFYRAKNDTTTRITGTGLGLYLTKFFVEAHKGFVKVESQPGVGSRFMVSLPLDLDQVEVNPKARKKA